MTVQKPTEQVLRNIRHAALQEEKRRKAVAAVEEEAKRRNQAFNPIRGLDALMQQKGA